MINPIEKQISDRIRLICTILDPLCVPELYENEIEDIIKSLEKLTQKQFDTLNNNTQLYKIVMASTSTNIINTTPPQELLYSAGLPLLFLYKVVSHTNRYNPVLFKNNNSTFVKILSELHENRAYHYWKQIIFDATIVTISPYIKYINDNIKKNKKLLVSIEELCQILRCCSQYEEYRHILMRLLTTEHSTIFESLFVKLIKEKKRIKEYRKLIKIMLQKNKTSNKIIHKIFKKSSPEDWYFLIKKIFLSYSTNILVKLKIPITSATLKYFIANNEIKYIVDIVKFSKMFYFVDEKACIDKIKILSLSEDDEVRILIRDFISNDNNLYASFIKRYIELSPKISSNNSVLETHIFKKINIKKIVKEQKRINNTEIQQLIINMSLAQRPSQLKEYINILKKIIPLKKISVRHLQ